MLQKLEDPDDDDDCDDMAMMMMMTRICRHHDRSPGGVQTHVPEDLALQACDSLQTH